MSQADPESRNTQSLTPSNTSTDVSTLNRPRNRNRNRNRNRTNKGGEKNAEVSNQCDTASSSENSGRNESLQRASRSHNPRNRTPRASNNPRKDKEPVTTSNISEQIEPLNGTSSESSSSSSQRAVTSLLQRQSSRVPTDQRRVAVRRPQSLIKKSVLETEVQQLERRYKGLIKSDTADGSKFLQFSLTPSDPDFPFDIQNLDLEMTVAADYPKTVPWIKVTNKSIPTGYSANVNIGFGRIAEANLGRKPLLRMIYELDVRLEEFLKMEKVQTIKIVRHAPSMTSSSNRSSSVALDTSVSPIVTGTKSLKPTAAAFVPGRMPINPSYHVPARYISPEVVRLRDSEISVMRKRLPNVSVRQDLTTGTIFNVILEPILTEESAIKRIGELLGDSIQLRLFVPKDYNVAPCSIEVTNVKELIAMNIQRNFSEHAYKTKNWSLIAQLNFIACEIMDLIQEESSTGLVEHNEARKTESMHEDFPPSLVESSSIDKNFSEDVSRDPNIEPDSSIVSSAINHAGNLEPPKYYTKTPSPSSVGESTSEFYNLVHRIEGRGIRVDLPGVELKNIAIVELNSISLVVTCNRCGSNNDIHDIVTSSYGKESKPVAVECHKCNQVLAASFRKDMVHIMCKTAGYLDVLNCKPFDYLPSLFTPTCGECSETLSSYMKRIYLSKPTSVVCFTCHTRMTLTVPEIAYNEEELPSKALHLSKPAKKTQKEKLGLVTGTPLPRDGCCKHYKKSQRWFRFACCHKALPCDKCHEEQIPDHHPDHIVKMICGKCSREQNMAKICAFCEHSFEKKFSSHWEGGKGTRDQVRMSKKDSRKYKRI
ncbi:hypothetical protein NADFUDRAFT_48962 [Nadsonia fulvescens var. elongata DSM 6958]|uniref:CHY-type domain-containing protein n=1 Tax=Nadsonia fulvescens var. elongata DSM 6958 TaxID=857566 RepID=A0A1E3PSA3_9ASCO|nr:hypothetical protein NADFUDRAFT_48962 [Nadsonia fulvescens var. elongata DSM 6958]